ncbi:DUF2953 domain-containing protein [Diplocloster modestus]|uniref:DUF2953 domain-containing protein n=1 Tax=Diplocloster modestus TaxID=2850322 RepID=A0ABS6K807_9FIRM|nr:DUF2953 domain-containing protein [Diplocloster modestus]MBU9726642.1 DUF2953 domain-containing protein [Diplocloster modestus]
MLHIILVILKIIGILLACIVGLLLLLALSVLLVPVRYRGRVEKNGEITAMGHIHWFLHVVSGKILYEDGEAAIKVRIFGIPIRLEAKEDKPPRKKKTRKKKARKQKDKRQETGTALPDIQDTQAKRSDVPGLPFDSGAPGDEHVPHRIEKESEKLGESEGDNTGQIQEPSGNPKRTRKKKRNWFKRLIQTIKNIVPNLKALFRKIKYTILEICGKIRNVKENIGYYRKVLKEEETKAALTAGKGELWKILKHIRPQKMKGYLHFGLGDPANTGIALGAISIFYSLYRDNIKILPDFEQAVLEGELYLKGRVRMIVLLLSVFRLYRDKNIRMTITRFRSKEV